MGFHCFYKEIPTTELTALNRHWVGGTVVTK